MNPSKRLREAIAGGLLRPVMGNARALAVWMVYASHANADGEAWPCEQTIAESLDCDDRTVRRGKRDLEKAGLLVATNRLGGERGPKVYRVTFDVNPTGQQVSGQIPDPTGQQVSGQHASRPDKYGHPTGQIRTPDRTNRGTRPDNRCPPKYEGRSTTPEGGGGDNRSFAERIGLRAVPPGVSDDHIARHYLDVAGSDVRDVPATIAARLRRQEQPGPAAVTPAAICRAIRAGVLNLNGGLMPVGGDVSGIKHNDSGLYLDGQLLISSDQLQAASFEGGSVHV